MDRTSFLNDLDALFKEIGEPTHEQALALYGYLLGLTYARAITQDDYRLYWDQLPLSGDELDELDINF